MHCTLAHNLQNRKYNGIGGESAERNVQVTILQKFFRVQLLQRKRNNNGKKWLLAWEIVVSRIKIVHTNQLNR